MAKVERKLDIFNVLSHIDRKDRQYYRNLTEEQQKALAPLVVMRWLSGTTSIRQIVFLNELVNHLVFSIHRHKELLYYMLTTCTSGRPQRYFWNKTVSKTSATPKTYSVIQEYFQYSVKQTADILPLLTTDDIIDYAEQLGRQPDEIKAIKKELKNK